MAGTNSKQAMMTVMLTFVTCFPAHDKLGMYNQPFSSKGHAIALLSALRTIAALMFFTCETLIAENVCSSCECQCS